MSEQEAFEKWLNDNYLFDTADFIHDAEARQKAKEENLVWKAWQAATSEANKRIAELEGEVAELSAELGKLTARYGMEYAKLQANNNDLREALEKAMNDEAGWYEIAKQALSATQAESLQAHDDELHEKLETALTSLRKYENGI